MRCTGSFSGLIELVLHSSTMMRCDLNIIPSTGSTAHVCTLVSLRHEPQRERVPNEATRTDSFFFCNKPCVILSRPRRRVKQISQIMLKLNKSTLIDKYIHYCRQSSKRAMGIGLWVQLLLHLVVQNAMTEARWGGNCSVPRSCY